MIPWWWGDTLRNWQIANNNSKDVTCFSKGDSIRENLPSETTELGYLFKLANETDMLELLRIQQSQLKIQYEQFQLHANSCILIYQYVLGNSETKTISLTYSKWVTVWHSLLNKGESSCV